MVSTHTHTHTHIHCHTMDNIIHGHTHTHIHCHTMDNIIHGHTHTHTLSHTHTHTCSCNNISQNPTSRKHRNGCTVYTRRNLTLPTLRHPPYCTIESISALHLTVAVHTTAALACSYLSVYTKYVTIIFSAVCKAKTTSKLHIVVPTRLTGYRPSSGSLSLAVSSDFLRYHLKQAHARCNLTLDARIHIHS